MSDNEIELKCPRCGHIWREDIAKLDRQAQVIYKGAGTRTVAYRARCPKCGAYVIVEVDEAEGDG